MSPTLQRATIIFIPVVISCPLNFSLLNLEIKYFYLNTFEMLYKHPICFVETLPEAVKSLLFDSRRIRLCKRVTINKRIANSGNNPGQNAESFVSSRILSDLAADRLCGRATRVFEVTEKSGLLQNFALKDQWIDDDRQAEGRVLEDLRALIKSEKEKGRFDDMHLPKDPTDYFLSVKAHGSVQVNATLDDNTSTTIMRGCSLPEGCPALSLPFSEKKVVESEVSGTITDGAGHIPYPGVSIASTLPLKQPRRHPRRHERTVFNEVGTPLHDLDNFADLFRGLPDATIALEIIHQLKRVHRDVSTGNILFYQGGGRLSDLEFLKELSSLQTHEVKTVRCHVSDRINVAVKGTRQFTAVEIEREKYCFRPVNDAPLLQRLALLSEGSDENLTPPPSVLFNPLHDHESIWWIACWALLHYIPANHIPNNDEELREQADYARRLFHPTIFAPERIEVLRHGLPPELAKNIPKRWMPSECLYFVCFSA